LVHFVHAFKTNETWRHIRECIHGSNETENVNIIRLSENKWEIRWIDATKLDCIRERERR
jgi:hypothetical protein